MHVRIICISLSLSLCWCFCNICTYIYECLYVCICTYICSYICICCLFFVVFVCEHKHTTRVTCRFVPLVLISNISLFKMSFVQYVLWCNFVIWTAILGLKNWRRPSDYVRPLSLTCSNVVFQFVICIMMLGLTIWDPPLKKGSCGAKRPDMDKCCIGIRNLNNDTWSWSSGSSIKRGYVRPSGLTWINVVLEFGILIMILGPDYRDPP